MNKLFVLIFAAAIILWGVTSLKTSNENRSSTISLKKITVYQRTRENSKEKFIYDPYEIEEGKTALDLLQKTESVKIKGFGQSAFVTAINGIEAKAAEKKYWAFYINGKLAEVGAGSYQLQKGDQIEWKLESY